MSVKPTQRAEIKGFTQGLVTEAGALAFPENASKDEINFDLDKKGVRFRRSGFDVEPGGTGFDTGVLSFDLDSVEFNTYIWEQPSGDTQIKFLCVQAGNRIFFFDPDRRNISDGGYQGHIVLQGVPSGRRYHMTSIEGFLVVAMGTPYVMVVEYVKSNHTFRYEQVRIKIRDVFGIEERIDPEYERDKSYRGATLNYEHYYNLFNQGWAYPRYDWRRNNNSLLDAVHLGSNKQTAKYPSNSDKVWLGMEYRNVGTDDDGQPSSVECFNYEQFIAITSSEVETAKGFYIIDALDRGASRQQAWNDFRNKNPQAGGLLQGTFSPLDDRTNGGPSTVTEFAGRIWYSGIEGSVLNGDARSPNYNNFVFFTQLIRNKQDFAKCYQEGDPTSRESSDVVDTDGGFLKISEAKQILYMFNIGSRLIVIASNGVWSIVGGSDYGFSATNYKVEKLSTFGGLAANSVVVEGGSAFYWAEDAIYTIGPDQFGDLKVTNMTVGSIKTYYDKIPLIAKKQAFGVYDKYAQRIRWMYRDTDILSNTTEYKELIFDAQATAFIPFKIPLLGGFPGFIISGFPASQFGSWESVEEVVVGDTPVYALSEPVVADQTNYDRVDAAVKYAVVAPRDGRLFLYFCYYHNKAFRDWQVFDGVGLDAEAFMETGEQTMGDVAVQKQIPFLTTIFKKTEKTYLQERVDTPSSCLAITKWDFTIGAQSGRWSKPFQLYRLTRHYGPTPELSIDTGFDLQINRTKIRGAGKSFSIRMMTEPYADCQVIGWSLTVTGNGYT